jgi:hypothetical protein
MSTNRSSRYLSWISTPQIHDQRGRLLLEEKNGVWIHYSYLSTGTVERPFDREGYVLEDFVPIFEYHSVPPGEEDAFWFIAGTYRTPSIVRASKRYPTGIRQERVRLWLCLETGCHRLEGVDGPTPPKSTPGAMTKESTPGAMTKGSMNTFSDDQIEYVGAAINEYDQLVITLKLSAGLTHPLYEASHTHGRGYISFFLRTDRASPFCYDPEGNPTDSNFDRIDFLGAYYYDQQIGCPRTSLSIRLSSPKFVGVAPIITQWLNDHHPILNINRT